MKKEKITSVMFFLAAVGFYAAAIVGYAKGNSMAIVWFCLGSAMLCLGSANLNRLSKHTESGEDRNKDDQIIKKSEERNYEKD